ncbi:MAG: hypothetical protein JSU69_10945 [Candidatus Zixiibacteriota bacterium]|nr:MAG: hypothetical protein JSU69_10945 [candidate division Zixibacteria bacterium]
MSKIFDKIGVLIGYLKGDLSKAMRRSAQAMVREDKDLKELYPIVEELYVTGQSTNWNEARSAALKISSQLFRDYLKSKRLKKTGYGVTVFDSQILPLPEGVRKADVGARRIKYRVGDRLLDVSLYPISSGSYEIIGQTSNMEGGSLSQVILKSGKETFTADTDAFNIFRFPRIPLDKYSLYLLAGRKRIGSVTIEL